MLQHTTTHVGLDAHKLAVLFRADELTSVRVPTPTEEAVRDLLRARQDEREDILRARHRLSKFLLRHGRIYTEGQCRSPGVCQSSSPRSRQK